MERLANLPPGADWPVQVNWAEHRSPFTLVAESKELPFRLACGGGQGDPHLPLMSAAAIQPHLLWLMEQLQPHGGGCMVQADNIYAWVPPSVVYGVVAEFAARVKDDVQVDMGPSKWLASGSVPGGLAPSAGGNSPGGGGGGWAV